MVNMRCLILNSYPVSASFRSFEATEVRLQRFPPETRTLARHRGLRFRASLGGGGFGRPSGQTAKAEKLGKWERNGNMKVYIDMTLNFEFEVRRGGKLETSNDLNGDQSPQKGQTELNPSTPHFPFVVRKNEETIDPARFSMNVSHKQSWELTCCAKQSLSALLGAGRVGLPC